MQHLFVPQELALKLKEKGFDEECLARWFCANNEKPILLLNTTLTKEDKDSDILTSAPLYQQVQDWFREKHFINIHADSLGLISYYGFVGKIGNYSNAKKLTVESKVLTYYEALTKAIEEAIKLI